MRNIVLNIVFLILLCSCSYYQVQTDYNESTNFSSFNSFAFEEPAQDLPINELDKDRIKGAIAYSLENKGYTQSYEPEMVITFHVLEEQRERITTYEPYPYYYGGGYGYWRGGYYCGAYASPYFYGGGGYRTSEVEQYNVAKIIVDIKDAKTNELVWQGIVTLGDLNAIDNPQRKINTINNSIEKLFQKYPPEL